MEKIINKDSDGYMPFYNEYEQYNPDIQYEYSSNYYLPTPDINYDNFCETNIEKNTSNSTLKLFNLDLNNDDLIIIAIVVFLFFEESLDLTILIALGLLFFSKR